MSGNVVSDDRSTGSNAVEQARQKVAAAFGQFIEKVVGTDLTKARKNFDAQHKASLAKLNEFNASGSYRDINKVDRLVRQLTKSVNEALRESSKDSVTVETLDRHAAKLKSETKDLDALVVGPDKWKSITKSVEKLKSELDGLTGNPLIAGESIVTGLVARFDSARAKTQQVDEDITAVLKKLETDLEQARRRLDSKVKAHDAYLKNRTAARDAIWEMRKLPGAGNVGGPVHDFVQKSESDLAELENAVSRAKDETELAKSAASVLKVSEQLAKARELSQAHEKEGEQERKAIVDYHRLRQEAEATLKQLQSAVGAEKWCERLRKLLDDAAAKIVTRDGSEHGFVAAAALLKDHGDVLKDYEQTALAYYKDPQGTSESAAARANVDRSRDAAQEALKRLSAVAPDHVVKPYRVEMAGLLMQSVKAPDEAIKGIDEVAASVNREHPRWQQAHVEAQERLQSATVLRERLERLQKSGLAPAQRVTRFDRLLTLARKKLEDGESIDAAVLLKDAIGSAEREAGEIEGFADKLRAANEQLTRMTERCKQLLRWRPLATEAEDLLENVAALRGLALSPEPFLDRVDALAKQLTTLEARAAQSVPQGLDIDGYHEAEGAAEKAIRARYGELAFSAYEQALERNGVRRPELSPVHAEIRDAMSQWEGFLGQPPGDDPLRALEDQKARTLDSLARMKAKMDSLLAGDHGVQAELVNATWLKQDQEDIRRLPDEIRRRIDDLARRGVDPARIDLLNGQLNDSLREIQGMWPSAAATMLRAVNDFIEPELRRHQAEVEQRKKAALENATKMRNNIKLARERTGEKFATYFEALDERVDDLTALAESGDKELTDLAKAELVKLYQQLKTDVPLDDESQKKQKGKLFADVEKRFNELDKTLGGVVREQLPDTYARLLLDLKQAQLEARGLSPEKALARLEDVAHEIRAASELAKMLKEARKRFDALKKDVEEAWKQVQEAAGLGWFDNVKSYQARYEARLNELAAMSKKEGRLQPALQSLDELLKELKGILASEDPRNSLHKLDAQTRQEQIQIEEWARQWEQRYESFRNVTLPKLDAEIRARGGDRGQHADLIKVGEQANRVAEPYLKLVASSPFKRIGARQGGDLSEARETFATARRILEDAETAARRAIVDPDGTNVREVGDVRKAAALWKSRCVKFSNAVARLAELIQKEASADPKEGVSTAGSAAAKALRDVAGIFRDEAFDGAAGRLATTERDGNQRRADREELLAVVRRYAGEFTSDEVLIALYTVNNPFHEVSAEIAGLRAALKTMELESLVGV